MQRADAQQALEVGDAEAAGLGGLGEDGLEVAGLGGAPALLEVGDADALGVRVLAQELAGGAGGEGVLGERGADGVGVAVGPGLHAAQELELGGGHAHVGAAQLEPALVDLIEGGGGESSSRPVIGRSEDNL